MSPKTIKPFVIFALNQRDVDADLKIIGERLRLPVKPLLGQYAGIVENSYLLTCPDGMVDVNFQNALELAHEYGQHSILYVDNDLYRTACLVYCQSEQPERIGRWTEISKPSKSGDWTFDPSTQKHYSVLKGGV